MNNDKYYKLKDLCDFNYIESSVLIDYIIENSNSKLVNNNIFRYNIDYYINIKSYYELCFTLNIYSVFEKIINNIYNLNTIFDNFADTLIFNTNIHYVYIFQCFTKLKIGYSKNVCSRIRSVTSATKTNCTCISLFEYSSMREARLVEQMLLTKFSKYIIKGEYLSNSPNIVSESERILKNHLIPHF